MENPFKTTILRMFCIWNLFLSLLCFCHLSFGQVADGSPERLRYEQRVKTLRSGGPYADNPDSNVRFIYRPDSAQSRRIREYFRLDTLLRPGASTWENTLTLASFVASRIPHANQKIQPPKRNAIALWEYHLRVEPAFNCRLHSIMLHELLLASGITNRFVTCLPADSRDPDCHVVNIVWLPENKKWAMIDSDGSAYVTGADGLPLSLEEMRRYTIEGKRMDVRPVEGGKMYDDYLSYWAKNLYWFVCWEETGYDKETTPEGRQVYLLPDGFDGFIRKKGVIVRLSDPSRFWAPPEN